MHVAEREQRPRHVHRQEQPRPAGEVADVDVAADLAGRQRAEPVCGPRRDGRRQELGEVDAGVAQDLVLAPPDLPHQLLRRRDADRARERIARHRDARQLRGSRVASVELPPDEVGAWEEIGEEAEAGQDCAEPEVAGVDLEQLDDQDVARLGSLHVDRPRQEILREVEGEQILVDAVSPDLISRAERRVERDHVAGPHDGHRLDVRMPAIVSCHRLLLPASGAR
jgi:hypothetical protein